MKPDIEVLRKKYIENPPEGMTSRDIRHMDEEELLDMDYFLNDDELDDDFGEEGFYLFCPKSSVCHARLRAGLFIQETAYGGLSYKVKNGQFQSELPIYY